MSGTYPDVPGPKIAYDVDGTVFATTSGAVVTEQSFANKQLLNDEDGGNTGERMTNAYGGYYVFLFPQLRDLVGYFWSQNSSGVGGAIEVSTDTTSGLDGTWTNIGTRTNQSSIGTLYRSAIQALAGAAGIKAIRFADNMGGGEAVHAIHLYGTITAGQTPDRLVAWHPTLNQALAGADLDFAEVGRGTTSTKTFRIKNISTTKTATTVAVARDFPTDAGVSLASQFQLSYAGGAYAASVNIGDLAPGAISGVITARMAVDAAGTLGPYVERIIAAAVNFV